MATLALPAPTFVLDNDWPEVAFDVHWPRLLRVVRLREVDRRLCSGLDDWQVMKQLAQMGMSAFVSCDANILRSPVEMVLLQSIDLRLVQGEPLL